MSAAPAKKRNLLLPILILAGFFLIFLALVFLVFVIKLAGSEVSFGTEPVAVVKIEGPIYESLDTLKELEELREDDDVKAVVVRIDSPGGAVAPSQELFEQLKKLRANKKIVVSMGTLAASGGYYIACAADKIVASAGTITGSIGVIIEGFGLQDLLRKVEVENRVIKSGLYKDAGNPFRRMEEFEREYLQGISDNLYQQFLTAVSENRKIPMEKMRELAQGKVYSGQSALEVGLVDALGNIYDAIALAKKEAGLPEKAGVSWPAKPSAFESFFKSEEAGSMLGFLKRRLPLSNLPVWLYQGAAW